MTILAARAQGDLRMLNVKWKSFQLIQIRRLIKIEHSLMMKNTQKTKNRMELPQHDK